MKSSKDDSIMNLWDTENETVNWIQLRIMSIGGLWCWCNTKPYCYQSYLKVCYMCFSEAFICVMKINIKYKVFVVNITEIRQVIV